MEKRLPTVPEQKQGGRKDIKHTETAVDDNGARKLFMIARNRLMSVNNWKDYAEGASADFRLVGPDGLAVDRTAEKGDYFQISIPAPGPAEGDGRDWVKVEEIDDRSDPHGPYESIAMRVRPVADPTKKGENVAHFFDNAATSSFVIERSGRTVTAAVYGRNEMPNTRAENLADKVRNTLVGIGAILGFSNIQWKNLVQGLVKPA